MSSVALHGFCSRLNAFILVDPTRTESTMALSFASLHGLPRRVVREPPSMVVRVLCSPTLSVRSASGLYHTKHVLSVVPFQRTWDIILGRDWCVAAGAEVQSGVLLDPAWLPSDPCYLWCAGKKRTLPCIPRVRFSSFLSVPFLPVDSPFVDDPFCECVLVLFFFTLLIPPT